eukprot:538163-Hanusia_phi.AAC.2
MSETQVINPYAGEFVYINSYVDQINITSDKNIIVQSITSYTSTLAYANSSYRLGNQAEVQLPNHIIDNNDTTAIVLNTDSASCDPLSVLIRFPSMYIKYMLIDLECEDCVLGAFNNGQKTRRSETEAAQALR